ncbi:MAG: hypothetical protein JSV56_00350, partial [Methanomassiliicoccales archaeon]
MKKIVTISISALLMIVAFQILLAPTIHAQEYINTTLYLYGDGDVEDFLLTDIPTSATGEEYNICPTGGIVLEWIIGSWETVPFQRETTIQGSFLMNVWVEQMGVPPGRVELGCLILIDGVDTGIRFNSEQVIVNDEQTLSIGGSLDQPIGAGQTFGIELHIQYLGTSLNVYWASDACTTHIVVPADWCIITGHDPVVDDIAETVSISAEVEHALGTDEIVDYGLEIEGPTTATSVTGPVETIIDNVITVSWVWDWGVDSANEGTYSVTITAVDNSGNNWDDDTSFEIIITQPPPPPPPPPQYNWTTVGSITSYSARESHPSLIQDSDGVYWLAYARDD